MQTLLSKDKGKFTFQKTWVASGNLHIGLLDGGGYMHIGGLPIKTKRELIDTIPDGPDRKAATDWFDRKDIPVEAPKKNIVILPDGNFQLEGGAPIESPADIVNNTSPGPVQDAMLHWFALRQKDADKQALKDQSTVKSSVKRIRQQVEEKKMQEELAE